MSDIDSGTLRLLDALAGDPPYDPRCERVEVALRAIWLLFRRAKWELLALTGLPRREFEPLFEAFDLLVEGHHLSYKDTDDLVRFAYHLRPQSAIRLLSAALWMVGKYRQRKLTYVGVRPTEGETDQ